MNAGKLKLIKSVPSTALSAFLFERVSICCIGDGDYEIDSFCVYCHLQLRLRLSLFCVDV